jgi:hypothetical protein
MNFIIKLGIFIECNIRIACLLTSIIHEFNKIKDKKTHDRFKYRKMIYFLKKYE